MIVKLQIKAFFSFVYLLKLDIIFEKKTKYMFSNARNT